jgi:hypothetical protein
MLLKVRHTLHFYSLYSRVVSKLLNITPGSSAGADMIEMAEFALDKLREPRVPGDLALAGSGAEAAGLEVIEASADALQAVKGAKQRNELIE